MKKRLVSLIIASLVISTATPAFAAETTEATVITDTQDSEDEAVSEDTEESTDTDEAVAEDTASDSILTDDENSDDEDYDDEDYDDEDYDDESDDEYSDIIDYDSDEDKSICPKSEDGQHEWTDILETNLVPYYGEVDQTLLEKWEFNQDCTKYKYVRICKLCGKKKYFGGKHELRHESSFRPATLSTQGSSKSYDYCYICANGEKFNYKETTIYSPSTITLSKSKYAYSGKSHKPSVTVKDEKGKTISSDNYTVNYSSGCTKVGKYNVKITFHNKKYSGTMETTFSIVPGKTSLSKLTSTKNSITAKWKKKTSQVTGYQIQYSTNKDFSSAKTISVSKNSSTKKISKLKQGTTYYVRVRTYKKTNGKKYYSNWSSAKSKKTQGTKAVKYVKKKVWVEDTPEYTETNKGIATDKGSLVICDTYDCEYDSYDQYDVLDHTTNESTEYEADVLIVNDTNDHMGTQTKDGITTTYHAATGHWEYQYFTEE